MTRDNKLVAIDYKKLKAIVKKRDMTMRELARKTGVSLDYYSCREELPERILIFLESVFNISREDIKPDVKAEPEPIKAETPVADILPPIDLREDIKALTDAVTKLGIIVKAAHEARFEHDQRVELMIKNALESETLYKSLFMPVFNAMRAAYNEPQRRIDGTPNYQNRR